VPAGFATALPDAVSDEAAIVLVRSGQVALGALRAARVGPEDSVLVTAAAGGVGQIAVQLARTLGAGRVVGAVGSPAKTTFLQELGVDEVVIYDRPGATWDLEPVDVVLDGAGGDVCDSALGRLATFGRFVTYNGAGGRVDMNCLRMRSQTVIGFSMANLASMQRGIYEQRRRELMEMAGRVA
jgi:NADPH:quinone reductase